MARRLKKAKVTFLSLVKRGANGFAPIFKGDDQFSMELLVKGMNDKGELTAIVYAPEIRDRHGDIADAEVIKDAMYEAARGGGVKIDLDHTCNAVGNDKAFIAEQFIVQKGDPRFADIKDYNGKAVDATGAWGTIIKILDTKLQEDFRTGVRNGVSMFGSGLFELNKADNGDPDMTLDELNKAIKDGNETLAKSLGTTLTNLFVGAGIIKMDAEGKIVKSAEAKPQPKTAFKGPFTPLGLKKHAVEKRKADLIEKTDWEDPASIAAAGAEMEAVEKELAEINDEIKKADDEAKKNKADNDPNKAEIAKLEKQIADLRGRSGQGAGEGKGKKGEGETLIVGLEKSEDNDGELVGVGHSVGAAFNKKRGFGDGK